MTGRGTIPTGRLIRCAGFCLAFAAVLYASIAAGLSSAADTSLIFVGEDISTLTIASRRAERPEDAPAVALVVTGEELEKAGTMTLGEALDRLPGFYILPRHSGSIPYLRGVPNSVLFLYDSVHLTSDGTKAVHPLDQELSLAPVKRVEVIRGPGSVLWGPDAFAGIVNVVPKRGRDVNGLEMRAYGGTGEGEAGATAVWGRNAGLWEALVSVSARSLREWADRYNVARLAGPDGRPVPPMERIGFGTIGRSEYLDAVVNFSWQDWLRISGRWTEAHRKYVFEDSPADLRWGAESLKPMRYIRMELEKAFGSSDLRLNAYYNEMDCKEEELGLTPRNQKNHITYAELLYDRELWGASAMLTMGASYRYNRIRGAEIAKSYPPDFFEPGNILFLPRRQQTNFSTSMASLFGQLKRHWNHWDAWLGFRVDDHSQYDSRFSPNLGVIWSPNSVWNMKLLYGTAYRTPYARQLAGREDLEPEQVQNASACVTWRSVPSVTVAAMAFWNQIRHQTRKDPYYGGLSDPGSQNIYGLELEAGWQINPALKLWANATAFSHDGDDEVYTYHVYILENGNWVLKPWASWEIPFETGPETMLNAGVLWNPTGWLDVSLSAGYHTSWNYYYSKGRLEETVPSNWIFDMTVTARDIFTRNLDIQCSVKNLLDRRFDGRGTYGPVDSPPFMAYLGLKWHY
ncbi:MAG TPA: TonB-dependent receptor [Thermodesulfobacteriaceae bacterium]|nr:TonB-dependent receptor [Thermodesulfobacteriaceae bacterium]